MSASPKYGSVTSSLWTPSQTGSFPLSAPIVAWLDAEDTNQITSFVDGGLKYVSTFEDKINDIAFGAPAGFEAPRLSDGTGSLLINNRNTLYFWEANLQFTPDTALTATLDAFDGHLAELNDPRYAFFVYKPLDYYPGNNFLYQYGDGSHNRAYGLALWVSGSGDLSDTDHLYFLGKYGTANNYLLDESDHNSYYYNNTGVGNLVYHQHSGTSGYVSGDANQTTGSYSGDTLITNNFDQDMQFWVGEEIGGGGRGIEFILAEMILITGSGFSTDDRQRVEGYLAHKWGLTGSLAASHPFHDTAPTNSDGTLQFTFTGANVAPLTGQVTGTYAVSRSGGSNSLTATIAATGTATPGANYVNIFPLNLAWGAGETGEKTFTVTFLPLPQAGDKTFIPFISASGNAAATSPTASVTNIIYPGFVQFSSSASSIFEAGGHTEINLLRVSGSTGILTASLLITGSAAFSDYTASNLTFVTEHGETTATASFASGQDVYQIAITASDDLHDESDETVVFVVQGLSYPDSGSLFFPSGASGTPNQHTLTIVDAETGSVAFSSSFTNTVFVTGTQTIAYSVERTIGGDGAAQAVIFVDDTLTNAVAGTDYTDPGFPITLNWADGETGSEDYSVTFLTGALDDRTLHTFIRLTTSASIGALSSSTTTRVAPGVINFRGTGSNVFEGGGVTVTLTRSLGTSDNLTSSIRFTGNALTGTDFTVNNMTLVSSSDGIIGTAAFSGTQESYQFEILSVDNAQDTGMRYVTASIIELEYPLSGTSFNPTASIGTGSTFILEIIDNESGSVDFTTASPTFTQAGGSSPTLLVQVNRSGGGDFAATATITQIGGSATASIDYTGLPATLNWNDQETGNKGFTLTAINPWGDPSTIIMGLTSLTNLSTGTSIPISTASITNANVQLVQTDTTPNVSHDYTINTFTQAKNGYKRKNDFTPFVKGVGTVRSIQIRKATPYSASLG